MRKCIYTAITGNYDILIDPKTIDPDWDYICFTDDPEMTSNVWKIVLLENPENLSPVKLSKRVKIMFHEYLPEYDLVVWIDAAYYPVGKISPFALSKTSGLHVGRHDTRKCAYEEASIIMTKKIDNSDIVKEQVSRYRSEGFPENYGLYKCGCIVRTKDCIELMKLWWSEVEKGSFRDQVSFTYCVWKTGYKVHPILMDIVEAHFKHRLHSTKISEDFKIRFLTSHGRDKYVGRYINDDISKFDPDDWICLRDGDTMFFNNNFDQYLSEVIRRYPATHLFGCKTNRIGLDWHLHNGFSSDPNILNHKKISDDLLEANGTACEDLNDPVAGFFMLFPKRVWDYIKFQDRIVEKDGIYFDWRFSSKVLKYGGKVRMIKGLYLFHFYRFDKSRSDKSHIM